MWFSSFTLMKVLILFLKIFLSKKMRCIDQQNCAGIYCPLVALLSTQQAHDVVHKNGLDFGDLLLPFSSAEISIRVKFNYIFGIISSNLGSLGSDHFAQTFLGHKRYPQKRLAFNSFISLPWQII